MVYKDYLDIVSENYDLSDSHTFNKVIMCTEAEKESVLVHLTSKLYNDIRNKVDVIDFGSIPQSKGNITKIDNYENLIECVNTITSLIREYNQPTEQIDVVSTAIENIQLRTRVWEKSFALNIELPIIVYNTMVLSIVSSISLMITTCIEYIKNADGTIRTAFDKAAYIKNKDHVLFSSLREFNFACSKGDLDKVIGACVKTNATAVKEAYENGTLNEANQHMGTINNKYIIATISAILLVANLKYIIKFFVYCLRSVVYYFMLLRQNVSDYFTIQADYLQINAENLQYRDMDDEKREKVKDRQMKYVARFRKWANLFMIKDKKARNDADKQQKEDNKPSKYEDEDDDDGGLF